MQSKWTERVEQWVEAHREEMVADIVELVRIKSVSDKNSPVKPYGPGCRNALHAMLHMAERYGFGVKNYGDTIGEIDLGAPGETIGFWGHLDVVPEGDGWDYAPYEGVVTHGLIIGRGAQDNKGQTVAVLYIMRCIKELGIPLRHNLKLFVGTDEEAGMSDLEWFLKHHEAPAFSIIADSNYPVCYGEKGIITAELVGQPLSALWRSLEGGSAPNVVPDRASAALDLSPAWEQALPVLGQRLKVWKGDDGTFTLEARGAAGHTAFPEGAVNAIGLLTQALTESGGLTPEDQGQLEFLNHINRDCWGTALGIACEDDMSGKLTCVGSMLRLEERAPVLTVNIRYPVTAHEDSLLSQMGESAQRAGFALRPERVDPAHYFPKEHPVVDALTRVYHRITGDNKPPFVLPGGTYSRKLRRSISFGMGFSGEEHPDKKGVFRPGHGGAHGPDECTVIAQLLLSIRIYVEGLLEIDPLEL